MANNVYLATLTLPADLGETGLYASPFNNIYVMTVVRADNKCEIYAPLRDGLDIESLKGLKLLVGNNKYGKIEDEDVRSFSLFNKEITSSVLGLDNAGFDATKVTEFISYFSKSPPPPPAPKQGSASPSSLVGAMPSQRMTQGVTARGVSEPFKLQNVYQLKDGSFAINSPDVILDKKALMKGDHFVLKITGEKPILIPIELKGAPIAERKIFAHWTSLLLEQEATSSTDDVLTQGLGGKINVKRKESNINVSKVAGKINATKADAKTAPAASAPSTTAATESGTESGSGFAYVPVTEIEWEFEGNYLKYGQGGSPQIRLVSYKPASAPKMPNVNLLSDDDANLKGASVGGFNAVETGIKRYIQSDDSSANPTGRPLYLTQQLNNAMNGFRLKTYRMA
jgi:hypothetical protein